MVVTSLIEEVLNAPTSSQESPQDLTIFLKIFDENISLLSAMNIPDFGSFIMLTMAFRTLPLSTRKLFESTMSSDVIYHTIDNILQFVRGRITLLENVGEPWKSAAKPKLVTAAGTLASRCAGKGNHVALVAYWMTGKTLQFR